MKGPFASPGRLREGRRGAVAVLTLDRAGTGNALGASLVAELDAALGRLARDRSVRAVVLTGAGGAFASGPAPAHCLAALKADPRLLRRAAPSAAEMRGSRRLAQLRDVSAFPKPLVAAVAGAAEGDGWALALACDLVVAERGARFSMPELETGTLPSTGGLGSLVRRAGLGGVAGRGAGAPAL